MSDKSQSTSPHGAAISPGTKEILDYISKHKITNILNEAVNRLCQQKPTDPWTFLAADLEKQNEQRCVISKLQGREVLDSRGNPTVEVDLFTNELISRGTAPSGASTGSNEARELRDGDEARYLGKGVQKAVDNVNTALSVAVQGINPQNQKQCDDAMCKSDGTPLKENLGGNAITAASFAVAKAGARLARVQLFQHFSAVFVSANPSQKVPDTFSLPTPMVNILNGGKHAGGNLKIQEFMILPSKDVSFKEGLRIVTTVYHHLSKKLVEAHGVSAKNLGDEGGFAPPVKDAEEALAVIDESIAAAGFECGKDVFLALDCAASEFYDEEKEKYEISAGTWKTADEMVAFYEKLVEDHPALISIEDGLHEKDYEGWIKLTESLGNKMSVGDDLYTTNPELIKQGIEKKWANALLLKVNQIGTVSEAMDAARLIFDQGQNVIVSHRSGDTPDSLIADLAVGIGAQYIKTGAPARGERISKYNRLLQIEEFLSENGMLREETEPKDEHPPVGEEGERAGDAVNDDAKHE
eukprot:770032_1